MSQLAHILRFVPRAMTMLSRDVRASFAAGRRNLRTLWLTTDPTAVNELIAQVVAHTPTAADDELHRQHQQRMEQRRAAFLRDGHAVYEGELYARPAWRGVVMSDLESRPDVEMWLAETVGLDERYGNTRRVRLIVEDPAAQRS